MCVCVDICRVNLKIYTYIFYRGPKPKYACVYVPREELTIEPCKLFVFHAKGQQLYITRGVYMVYYIVVLCVYAEVECIYIIYIFTTRGLALIEQWSLFFSLFTFLYIFILFFLLLFLSCRTRTARRTTAFSFIYKTRTSTCR